MCGLRENVENATTDYGGYEAVMCSPSSPRHLESQRKGTALRDICQMIGISIAFDTVVQALEGYEPNSTAIHRADLLVSTSARQRQRRVGTWRSSVETASPPCIHKIDKLIHEVQERRR
ncbi:hypothetical protein BDQ17DRAFT_1332290 [Cyathus striatus]|nr:hypothetical protein BDQ17DRAFT_1332290 [Cyathus striatus]